MRVQSRSRTLTFKLVYYGAGLGGKTTNLRRLHSELPNAARGDLIQLDTEHERTLFFDHFPATLGRFGGYRLRVNYFTVPGQSFYHQTRRAVLKGADGVVFVADSAPQRELANMRAAEELGQQLDELGLSDLPVVYQWNKRDLPQALPVPVMERSLNPRGLPSVEASALQGFGVQRTQSLAMREVLLRLRQDPSALGGSEPRDVPFSPGK